MKKILMVFLLMSLTSCSLFNKITGKDKTAEENELNYMQNIEQVAIQKAQQNDNTLQIGDELMILISAKDLDVVKPFNQNYSSSSLIQESSTTRSNVTPNRQTSSGPTYIIDSYGNIDFPILGEINAQGKTIEELKSIIKNKLTKYIISPTVTIKQTNYKITVLGEVKNPGEFVIIDNKATLLSALGLAGDLTIYGNRDDILVVRNVDGEITKGRVDLSDANFINSPYYDLKQGDVVYVSANKTQERTSKRNPNAPIYISVASILVTILALIFR